MRIYPIIVKPPVPAILSGIIRNPQWKVVVGKGFNGRPLVQGAGLHFESNPNSREVALFTLWQKANFSQEFIRMLAKAGNNQDAIAMLLDMRAELGA
ncbi:MAG: hypothetical protein WCV91_02055 [Candidatus Margulisiibacteriota bacterium]|jgi:hypothetical protein